MWWLAGAGLAALAAPVGNPLVGGWLGLSVRGDTGITALRDPGCAAAEESCDALRRATATGVELRLTPVRGLSLSGEIAHQTEHVRAADITGTGRRLALSARFFLPITGREWWVGGAARMAWTRLRDDADVDGLEPEINESEHTASLLAAWGGEDEGFSGWFGGQAVWVWRQRILPFGDEPDDDFFLALQPRLPGGLVVGCSLTSASLGSGWGRGAHLSVGIEGRAGQDLGVSAWIGSSL